jgi:hypothetical protein
MNTTEARSEDESSGEGFVTAGEFGAIDEERVDPDSIEDVGLYQPVRADARELDEIGAELDDPEEMVTIDGSDDPDGLGEPANRERSRRDDAEGWDLDASQGEGDEPG